MADFSKQYCERYDADVPYDFDIEKEFADPNWGGNTANKVCKDDQ